MIYIACENLNMIWTEKQVIVFEQMWKDGASIVEIANHFKRKSDEIGLLIIDRASQGYIRRRKP